MANTQNDKRRQAQGAKKPGTQRTARSGNVRKSTGAAGGRLTRAQRMELMRRRRRYVLFLLAVLAATVIGIIALVISAVLNKDTTREIQESETVSQDVQNYKPMIEKYAADYEVSGYVDLLMAIMQVESGGQGRDVMQSSESLGLAVNSLDPEPSIEQGCKVFSQLLSYSRQLGCDINSVIQAYNFGITYLTYVSEHGKVHTSQLAEDFARDMSGGETVTYRNDLSVERNGGWRYNYGNMFYVELVRQYWSGNVEAESAGENADSGETSDKAGETPDSSSEAPASDSSRG